MARERRSSACASATALASGSGFSRRRRREERPPIGAFGRFDGRARQPQQPTHLAANQYVVGAQLVFEPVEIIAPAVEQIDGDLFERLDHRTAGRTSGWSRQARCSPSGEKPTSGCPPIWNGTPAAALGADTSPFSAIRNAR